MKFWKPKPISIQFEIKIVLYGVLLIAFAGAVMDSDKPLSDDVETSTGNDVTGNFSSTSSGETFKDCVFKLNSLEEPILKYENKELQIMKHTVKVKVGIRNYPNNLIGGTLEAAKNILKVKLKRVMEASLDEPATAVSIDRMTNEILEVEKEIFITIEVPGMTKYVVHQIVGICGEIEMRTPIRRHRAEALFDDEDSSTESEELEIIHEVVNEALKIESEEEYEQDGKESDDCDNWDSGCSMGKQDIQDTNEALPLGENINENIHVTESNKQIKERTFQFHDLYHDQNSAAQFITKPSAIFTFVLLVLSCICRPLFQHL